MRVRHVTGYCDTPGTTALTVVVVELLISIFIPNLAACQVQMFRAPANGWTIMRDREPVCRSDCHGTFDIEVPPIETAFMA